MKSTRRTHNANLTSAHRVGDFQVRFARRPVRAVLSGVVGVLLFYLVVSPVRADDSTVRTNSGVAVQQKAATISESESNAFIIRRPSDSNINGLDTEKGERVSDGMPGLGNVDAASMTWPLLVVLGLIFIAALAVRKLMPRGMRGSGISAINILARQHLSNKQSLCLVQVGRRVVLVGITGEQMSALSEITDREELGELTAKLARSAPSSFSATLEKVSGGNEDAADEATELKLSRRSGIATATRRRPANVERSSDGNTDQRVRDLVSRIRALSVGTGDS